MNSEHEDVLDQSSESDSDNEEDVDENDFKEKERKKQLLGKRKAGSYIYIQQMVPHLMVPNFSVTLQ